MRKGIRNNQSSSQSVCVEDPEATEAADGGISTLTPSRQTFSSLMAIVKHVKAVEALF